MAHNYFFVAFFLIANLFLQNVLIGFIIDNIVAFLSENFADNDFSGYDDKLKDIKVVSGMKSLGKNLFKRAKNI